MQKPVLLFQLFFLVWNPQRFWVSSFSISTPPPTDVVVMGIGDLRVTDHGGLWAAHSHNSGSITVAILLTNATLQEASHMRSHTQTTVELLHQACTHVTERLQSSSHIENVLWVTDLERELPRGAERYHVWWEPMMMTETSSSFAGTAYHQLMKDPATLPHTIVPWNGALRPGLQQEYYYSPSTIAPPQRYPDYQRLLQQHGLPLQPYPSIFDTEKGYDDDDDDGTRNHHPTSTTCSSQELLRRVTALLDLDPAMVAASAQTGLYGTHWADPTMSLHLTTTTTSPTTTPTATNPRSWEHATMQWQKWCMPHEMETTRWTAAPLWLGTIGLRELYYHNDDNDDHNRDTAERREWHQWLAATTTAPEGGTTRMHTGYWYYQGFLCRYLATRNADAANTSSSAAGLVLVHGFGASGAQWHKCVRAIGTQKDDTDIPVWAPDLLGFGQSEKPALSYTSYLWEAMLGDFIKDIVTTPQYIVGGNSIGGYCSMALAANECAGESAVATASGAPGTGRCVGLVLMNSAGIVRTEEEEQQTMDSTTTTQEQRTSVGERTWAHTIPPSQPPPRPLVRLLGNGLLSYLRPNIRSICTKLYPTNTEAVDDVLCDAIERDSLDPGAIYVMMSGTKLPPPRTANELLAASFGLPDSIRKGQEGSFQGPVLIAQGVLDPLNDAPDRMVRFRALRQGITAVPIAAGHCPHDECPKEMADTVVEWMRTNEFLALASSTAPAVVGKQ